MEKLFQVAQINVKQVKEVYEIYGFKPRLEGPKNYEKSKNPNDKYGQRRSDFN
jgi:hypothetical protein